MSPSQKTQGRPLRIYAGTPLPCMHATPQQTYFFTGKSERKRCAHSVTAKRFSSTRSSRSKGRCVYRHRSLHVVILQRVQIVTWNSSIKNHELQEDVPCQYRQPSQTTRVRRLPNLACSINSVTLFAA